MLSWIRRRKGDQLVRVIWCDLSVSNYFLLILLLPIFIVITAHCHNLLPMWLHYVTASTQRKAHRASLLYPNIQWHGTNYASLLSSFVVIKSTCRFHQIGNLSLNISSSLFCLFAIGLSLFLFDSFNWLLITFLDMCKLHNFPQCVNPLLHLQTFRHCLSQSAAAAYAQLFTYEYLIKIT